MVREQKRQRDKFFQGPRLVAPRPTRGASSHGRSSSDLSQGTVHMIRVDTGRKGVRRFSFSRPSSRICCVNTYSCYRRRMVAGDAFLRLASGRTRQAGLRNSKGGGQNLIVDFCDWEVGSFPSNGRTCGAQTIAFHRRTRGDHTYIPPHLPKRASGSDSQLSR